MAKRKSQAAVAGTLTVRGVEYVVIPKADYLRMQDVEPTAGAVDAHTFVRQSIAVDLRAAREHAGLTQSELAEKLGKSQTLVSQAESGTAHVSERYVRTVLDACGLPENWTGSRRKASRRRKAG
jgi:ribosome-binding protein aMBF1 (putative translation factor)